MASLIMKGTYTGQGWQGVASEGFKSRENTIKQFVESQGGKLVGLYFSTGADWDWMVIAEGLDPSIAGKAQIMASGAYGWTTTDVVVSASEADAETSVRHRTPGQSSL